MLPANARPRLIATLVGCLGCLLFVSSTRSVPSLIPPDSPSPAVPGAYTSSARHPRVFMSQSDLNDLATRINSRDTFSAQKFSRLASLVKADVAADVEWDAAYSGCDIDIYLHTLSVEETRVYASEVRSQDRIRSELRMHTNAKPPAGVALVASRLALYAALVKAGAVLPQGAPTVEQATALAKRILLAWASRGFRARDGSYFQSTTQFCEQNGAVTPASQSAVGLQISRGVFYSVHAQDLLQSLGVLTPAEEKQVNAFHSAMYELIRNGLNYRFELIKMPCDRYSNHVASQLTGLLATARLLDDRSRFLAALYGGDSSIPVELPWTTYFSKAIYGESETPNACFPNTGSDGLTSRPFFQTPVVAPGEIDDRFRNANALQGIGYSMGTLEHLFAAADIMKLAGLDAYSYRGAHKQSIEMATQYYACYAKSAGFKKTVTAEQARACSDYPQYIGKVVNDAEPSILMGTSRFPGNTAITGLDAAAKAESLRDASVDTIRFGRWTN
jgi:hypothetical protein